MNKEFYDYRNSALKRMKRIREESDLFADRHEALRLDYAFTEFSSFLLFITIICSNGRRPSHLSTGFRKMKL